MAANGARKSELLPRCTPRVQQANARSALGCGTFQVRPLGHERRQRCSERGQEEDYTQDQEAGAQAVDNWQLEGERNHKYAHSGSQQHLTHAFARNTCGLHADVLADAENKAPPPSSASPTVNPLEEKTIAGFPNGRPLDDKVDTVQCKHCRRPVLRTASASHIRECLNKKQEKLKKKKEAKEAKDAALRKEKGEDDEGIGARKSAVKGAVIDGEGAKKGKKRKIEDGAEKGPNAKKKKKDEPKAKGAKPKGPVDVERQCGVSLPNGGFCARSLTCKSHSMGLKRAVPGRSLPYDMLLAQYQKKNQAKQQREFLELLLARLGTCANTT
jgi:hypothetical protein